MKTVEQIKQKINEGFENDFLGFGISDIIYALSFEDAVEYLTEDFKSKETAKEEWEADSYKTDEAVKKAMLDYLPFAWEKCRDERGLSADRSIQHFIAWAWLIDDEFCNEIERMYNENYSPYGRPILEYIGERLGYKEHISEGTNYESEE